MSRFKKSTIYLAIMFTPGIMVIKSQKWLISIFCADDSQKLVTLWTKYVRAPVWLIHLKVTVREISRVEISKHRIPQFSRIAF